MAETTQRVAFITGISGQDGYYLSQLLIGKGYDVHGLIPCNAPGIGEPPGLNLHYGDLADGGNFGLLLDKINPDEVYNLAGAESCATVVRSPDLHG